MSRLVGRDLMRSPRDLALWRNGHDYYALGRKVFRLSGGSHDEAPVLSVYDTETMAVLGRTGSRLPVALRRSQDDHVRLLREANSVRMAILEEEAIGFLREVRQTYPDMPLVVSWSGGKDSAVASAVARRAFPEERITHVFADTTIELPATYEHLRQFRKENPATPFLVGIPARDFLELCQEIGPPSRVQRWCCSTHKAAPLSDALRAVAGADRVMTVTGLRRMESAKRNSYERVTEGEKIGAQYRLSPLLDWSDYELWCWILTRGIDFNAAYRSGFDRVGCAFCPNSGDWTEMLLANAFPAYWRRWLGFLARFFEDAGVTDAAAYVRSGAWRGRAGGAVGAARLPRSGTYDIATVPCVSDECAVAYEFTQEFDVHVLAELLTPFGRVSGDFRRAEAADFDVLGPYGSFSLRAIPLWKRVRVAFADLRTRRRLEGALRLQFRKLQACVGCGACAALCPGSAIVSVGAAYQIVDDRCTNCLACVRGIEKGCRAAASVNVARGRVNARRT